MIDGAEMAALKVKVEHLEQKVVEMASDLRAIRDTLAELRGGKRALWLLMGAAGSLGAGVTWMAQHVTFK
ncbi:MAG TPA: hypothetical protein VFG64_07295 [Dongiaceae bacterium]|jgi:hypothetical protein|nr:hypothetical protein [Dongiaceae bacterium]